MRNYIIKNRGFCSVKKSLIKFNKIVNWSYAKMKKSSAKVNLTDDLG